MIGWYSTPLVIAIGIVITLFLACGTSIKGCGDFFLSVLGMIAVMLFSAWMVTYIGRPF